MKIGVYIGQGLLPAGTSLKKEGLYRYIVLFIKAMISLDNNIVIACPKWAVDDIRKLFEDYSVNETQVRYLTTKKRPFSVRVYQYFSNISKSKKPSKVKKVIKQITSYIMRPFKNIYYYLITSDNVFIFGATVIVLFFLGIIFSSFIFPLVIILLLARLIHTKFIKRAGTKIFRYINVKLAGIKKRFLRSVWETIRLYSMDKIINEINKDNLGVDVWFCPTAFWPEFSKIKKARINCIPDLVTAEFPASYSVFGESIESNDKAIRKCIKEGKYFITYSEHVKKKILIDKFAVDEEKIKAVGQFSNDLGSEINVKQAYNFNYSFDANWHYAKLLLPGVPVNTKLTAEYLHGHGRQFSFMDVKYIFYASQIRPSKNVLNLVKAYEYLLRRDMIQCKLFLTGDLTKDSEVSEYIKEKQLTYDIISFHDVSNQHLAALYACADLVVNPTLHEGGFPFTFSEAISVGTPSIMGNIDQVQEVLASFTMDDCLFDPYDYADIAEKILYGLQNKEQIVKRQKDIYEQIKFTYDDRGGRAYEEAFEYFIKLDNKLSLV